MFEFLLFDSGPEFHRIQFFGTHHNVEMLKVHSFGWLMVHSRLLLRSLLSSM